jgi:hypothetical protein
VKSAQRTIRDASGRKTKWILSIVSLAAMGLVHREASAEIPLANANGFEVSIDGRVNAFINFSQGDKTPEGVAEWTAGLFEPADPNSDKIAVTRIRSGFVTNVLGFNIRKQLAPDLKLSGRIGLWMGSSNERKGIFTPPAVDPRELYLKLEGPWGMLLAGRDLGLFARGGTLMDAEIVHANGMGSPCTTRQILGGACGFVGHGVLFPYFNAGFLYGTPNLSGFQGTVGLYDPSINSEKGYEITPYPRVEAQLAYNLNNTLKVFGEAMWERLINTAGLKDAMGMVLTDANGKPKDQIADATGFAAGASVSAGPLQLGGSFYTGKGVTLVIPIFNTPIFADQMNVLRTGTGFVGMASLTFGDTKIAGGAGVSQLKLTPNDKEPFAQIVPPKQQLGISVGLYQTFYKQLVWALEYFRGQYSWYKYQQSAGAEVQDPTQNVNFFNTGLTFVY